LEHVQFGRSQLREVQRLEATLCHGVRADDHGGERLVSHRCPHRDREVIATMELDNRIPPGPLASKWEYAKSHYKLVNPANKRKYDIIVVGAGLAGASPAGPPPPPGDKVKCFLFSHPPPRPHPTPPPARPNPAQEYNKT